MTQLPKPKMGTYLLLLHLMFCAAYIRLGYWPSPAGTPAEELAAIKVRCIGPGFGNLSEEQRTRDVLILLLTQTMHEQHEQRVAACRELFKAKMQSPQAFEAASQQLDEWAQAARDILHQRCRLPHDSARPACGVCSEHWLFAEFAQSRDAILALPDCDPTTLRRITRRGLKARFLPWTRYSLFNYSTFLRMDSTRRHEHLNDLLTDVFILGSDPHSPTDDLEQLAPLAQRELAVLVSTLEFKRGIERRAQQNPAYRGGLSNELRIEKYLRVIRPLLSDSQPIPEYGGWPLRIWRSGR